MNSTVKVALPIVLVVLLVFGATLVSMYTGTEAGRDTSGDGETAIVGPPLLFDTTRVMYDPNSPEETVRHFPGFFEPGEVPIHIWFWFRNPYPVPVRFAVIQRSCTSCTSARVCAIESPNSGQFQAAAAAAGPAAPFLGKLDWKALDFENPDSWIDLPAGVSEDEPTWGMFEMSIKVRGASENTLSVDVGLAAGKSPPTRLTFRATVVGVPPFAISPGVIDLGKLPEGSPAQVRTIYYWSSTRDQENLTPPTIALAQKDPFLEMSIPEPMSAEDRKRLMQFFIGEGKPLVRIASGYKMTMTVHRKLPNPSPGMVAEPDLGPFSRQVGVTGPSGTSVALNVNALMTGSVGLADGTSIDLKDFESRFGVEKTVNLVSDRLDLELELVPSEYKPNYLQAEIGPATLEGGRKYWPLKITVPKGRQQGELAADSVVVFLAKSPQGSVKVRIPIKGRAFDRGK